METVKRGKALYVSEGAKAGLLGRYEEALGRWKELMGLASLVVDFLDRSR
jgi:hypothetical protein